jgi:hypothetical protein
MTKTTQTTVETTRVVEGSSSAAPKPGAIPAPELRTA